MDKVVVRGRGRKERKGLVMECLRRREVKLSRK